MKCPNCDKEMKDKSYWYYGIGDWDMDYPATLHEEYRCIDCNIKYINDEWIIPKKFERATYKQIKCAAFINRQLGTNFEPILKTSTWKFIKDNLTTAKEIYNHSFSDWCLENSDWLPEYF